MLIRAAGPPPGRLRVDGADTLLDPRLADAWNRHARNAALGLHAAAGIVLLDHEGSWVVAGQHGEWDRSTPGSLSDDLRLGPPDDPALARADVARGIGCPLGREWGESAALCVVASAPRVWSAGEWALLETLAESLRAEVSLRLQLAEARAGGPPARPAGVPLARLHLGPDRAADIATALRRSILAAVHHGAAQAGDRLPSIREVADACGTSAYAVVQAYRTLEDEGLVEKRERSGVFIASLGETPVRRLPETANWLRGVVADGYLLQVKLPGLPDLIQRWTASTPLRCACVEATEDYRVALAEEIRGHFGLDAIEVATASDDTTPVSRGDSLENAVRRADLVVTTPFHLARVRGLAARLAVPLVVATLDDASSRAIARRVRSTGDVVLVCVDAEFGRRMTINLGDPERERVRIVTVGSPELRSLDPASPVLMTRAARRALTGEDFRLLLPQYPAFSRRFAERLAHTIIQLNLEGLRRKPALR